MAQVILDNLHKAFGDQQVITDLSITIEDGEFFTFVGPSGCGKSTILNMIAGLESVTEGTIVFDETPVNELTPRERDVAMVFQSYALYPHMTVYENLAFPLKMRRTGKDIIRGEVQNISSLLGLENLLNRKPRELSGGQRQRVALGRAIIRKPRVFLMDEPLSNLDARLRVEMRAELKRLHSRLAITTVYVTHDQAEAMSMSDRIAVISDGQIQQCGTPREIYLTPKNMMVAGFVGSPPMNFIAASADARRPGEILCNNHVLTRQPELLSVTRVMIAGIRPEDITVSAEKSAGSSSAVVSLIEGAGSFNWVDLKWGDVLVKGHAGLEEKLKPGDVCYLSLSPDKVLVFDKESGMRI